MDQWLQRARLRSQAEQGYVLLAVLALLVVVMAIGLAALTLTLSSNQLTTHDLVGRRAQQASDTGSQVQLYQQGEANISAAYNFNGGVLGLSNFLDCAGLSLDANLNLAGISAYASVAGVCPGGGTSASSKPTWSALDNHAYYESEFLSNKTEVGGSGVGSVVEFPEILSIGCDATAATNCAAGTGDAYSRELTVMAPTAPLNAIEGMGQVTINGLGLLGLGASVINGDVVSNVGIALPTVAGALNTNFSITTGLGGLQNILPTFAAPAGKITGALISTAHNVTVSGFCSAENVESNCIVKRLPVAIATTSCAMCSTGIACTSCTGGGYNSTNDTFTLTGGSAAFAAGDYEFCNFNATGGAIATDASATTPVRIFILPPNSPPCSTNTYTTAQKSTNGTVGNFTASQGITNNLSDTVNNVVGTLDPSGLQVYVAGDGSYDNNTSVSIGDGANCTLYLLGNCVGIASLSIATVAMTVYAPTSAVTVNTGTCLVGLLGSCTLGLAGTFAGSLIGDNVNVTAAAITQDLDLGNYPLYSGTYALQPQEYVQCDNSVENLTDSTTDTNGC